MRLTRRRALAGTAAAGAVVAGGTLLRGGGVGGTAPPAVARAAPPLPEVDRPERQHAWDGVLRRDDAGNVLPPRWNVVLLLELAAEPTPRHPRLVESALRGIEAATERAPDGVLLTVGWGPSWFRRLGRPSPVPVPRALSEGEAPDLPDLACAIHLASDDRDLLRRADAALTGEGPALSAGSPALTPLLRVRARRVGFVGAGLPRANQRGTVGLPQDRRISRAAPLNMGFQSGLRRNQATEDDVTIASGEWAGGTTMHVSLLEQALETWYARDRANRTAHMFGADTTPSDVAARPTGLENPVRDLAAVARRRGLIGHAESMAAARRDGRPRILRRDFNGRDGGVASTHFVSLQRSIEDFERTRRAMDAPQATSAASGVGAQINNGINEWITVVSRANFLVPPRSRRACPGL